MAYFEQDFLNFFKELSKNNSKEWFDTNRKRYEKSVKEPFKNFVELMIELMRADDPAITMAAKDGIFRLNRDIRFSADKTPYKIQASAIISAGGKKDKTFPGIYFQFSAEDARIYSGCHMLEKGQLQNVREHIVDNLDEFNKLITDKKFTSTFGQVLGEKNKRLPKEFQEIEAKQPLIANKGFYYFVKFKPDIILQDDLPEVFMKHYEIVKPLKLFFSKPLMAIAQSL
ncbi:DUF2461 domain-containing protein [Cytophagaceae bacterium AH-315-L13]|nr:DUF2461 domain-containing protein [Cytophagaceae bacterium AH-315-L13]